MEVITGMLMVLTLAGAILAVSLKNILHAVFGLAISLLGIAGLFAVLGSPFVAAMEVLIYIGGISVAMLFVVMLSAVQAMKKGESITRRVLALSCSGLFFITIAAIISNTEFAPIADRPASAWSIKSLGANLLDRYNVVFETLSIVLLLAIIGAIVISKQTSRGEDTEQ